jgi:hypothetical protein
MPRINNIQVRRDTAANWSDVAKNPVLAAGEIGLETNTRLIKAGDGSTAWNSLSYLAVADGSVTTDKIVNLNVTEGKIAANAVSTGKLATNASIRLVNDKSFIVQTTQPTTRPGGSALVTGDVWISYTP